MKVNIKGLINRLDDLRERINDLFDKLEKFDDLEQEEIAIEDVKQYLQNDDTFNLSIALDILEQTEKLDKAFEIIEEKGVNIRLLKETDNTLDYNELIKHHYGMLSLLSKEYELLKEVFK